MTTCNVYYDTARVSTWEGTARGFGTLAHPPPPPRARFKTIHSHFSDSDFSKCIDNK